MRSRWGMLGSAMVLIWLASFVPGQGVAAREQNVCISYEGDEIYQSGSATCYSDPGGSAVAVGNDSYAEAYDSDFTDEYNSQGNTSVAVGDDSYTSVGDTSNGTGVAVGDGSEADINSETFGGTNNTSVATGDDSHADVEESNNSTAIALDEGSDVEISGANNCFVIELFGTEYEFGDCD